MAKWHPKAFSRLTGVSVRTLHHYDEIGLLIPTVRQPNGYRLYSEGDLLKLQQIIALKFFGFELAQIKNILAKEMDDLTHFQAQMKVLEQQITQMQKAKRSLHRLIAKLESKQRIPWNNIIQLIEGYRMTEEIEKIWGFDMAQQKEYEKFLITKGYTSQHEIDKGWKKIKDWDKDKWKTIKNNIDDLNKSFVLAIQKNLLTQSPEVQNLVTRHCQWLTQFWIPNKEKYIGLGRMYCDNADFKKYYDAYHPQLAEYLAEGMKIYAERELP